jgi:hypothetical protein
MALNINDGSRDSRLTLDRRATGELEGAVPREHLDALAAARARVAPFDYEILRAASHRVTEEPEPTAPRARSWWSRLLPVMVLAATVLLVVRLGLPDDPREGTRTRGGAFLDTFVLQDGVGQPWEPGTVLSEGDRVQFAYSAEGHGDTLVLLSIDGEGRLTVFWPAEGDIPEPISPDGQHLLTDSIALDDAAGPECFAFFGLSSVAEAERLALDVYATGGAAGLRQLSWRDAAVDVVIIDKE